MEYIQLHF